MTFVIRKFLLKLTDLKKNLCVTAILGKWAQLFTVRETNLHLCIMKMHEYIVFMKENTYVTSLVFISHMPRGQL